MSIIRGTILTFLFMLLAVVPSQRTSAAVFNAEPASTDIDNRALIIVAGRFKEDDRLQINIHNVTNQVYESAKDHNYNDDDIYYIATDETLVGYDATATLDNLQYAITEWATQQLESGGTLGLYLISHGSDDEFYIDGDPQILTSTQLDNWLTELEGKMEPLSINVVVEVGEAGSFVSTIDGSISGADRVVITSTDDDLAAFSSQNGALFSDHFIVALQQGKDIAASFSVAKTQSNFSIPTNSSPGSMPMATAYTMKTRILP